MTDREVMQQALECIERLNMRGSILADFEDEVYAAITSLKAALEQEPTPWRDMVVVSLVREGIDKHRARELADHFAAQRPWQGLTDEDWGWVADKKGTSLDTFDQGAAWAQARLMERNK